MVRTDNAETLLTPAEVAALFRVDPKTVTRWAKAGKLSSIRTLGGHRRDPWSLRLRTSSRVRFRSSAAPKTDLAVNAPEERLL